MIISQKVDCQCPADHHEYVDDTLTLRDKSDDAQCGLESHVENIGANDAPVKGSTIVAD